VQAQLFVEQQPLFEQQQQLLLILQQLQLGIGEQQRLGEQQQLVEQQFLLVEQLEFLELEPPLLVVSASAEGKSGKRITTAKPSPS
jgi:hypothetical protein